jgi:hypothetical protein
MTNDGDGDGDGRALLQAKAKGFIITACANGGPKGREQP